MVSPTRIRVALDAHVVGRRGTGNETYVVNLAGALDQRDDVDPRVYVDAGALWPGPEPSGIRRLSLRTPFLRIPLELPVRSRQERADLLHVQYVAPPVAGLPVVTTIHDLSFEDQPHFFRSRTRLRLQWFVRRSARRSASIVTISEFTRRRLIHHYDLDPGRVFVTPLAVAARWRPIGEEERARRLQNVAIRAPFVLAIGNMHPRKNIPRLVRATDAARRAGAGDLQLVLAGSRAWRAAEVDAAIDAVGARSWTHFTGYVDDDVLQALYGEARVVAYPSMYEGFGLPVLEALACGAVVVASNVTAVPEAAGDAALLVSPSEDHELATALLLASTDEVVRARLKAAGPAHASRFTWENVAAGTVRAYRAALDRGRVEGDQ